MSFPRLVEKYGRQYSWKMMLNCRTNLNERQHAIVGECNDSAREAYFKGWKRSLNKRVRPTRHNGIPTKLAVDPRFSEEFQPGNSMTDPKYSSLRKRVAKSLSQVRSPQLNEFIEIGDVLGSGVEGVVRKGLRKDPELDSNLESSPTSSEFSSLAGKFVDDNFVVKTVEKLNSSHGFSSVADFREVKVLEKINERPHPNITSYLHTFESPIRLHIVTECNDGGDLFNFLQMNDFVGLSEQDSARVLMQLLCAVKHTHESGFVHLDLKLENVMRASEGEAVDEGGVRLIDFGHASKNIDGKTMKLNRPVGSPSYASPEVVLEKTYSPKSDSWSLGVVMYILLQGYLPFPHLQQKRWREFSINDYGNFEKGMQENDPFYYTGDWEHLSNDAKNLCQSLMQVNPKERLDISEAMDHPWFGKNGISYERDSNNTPLMKVIDTEGEGKSFFALF